jgi:hypothetical protein
MRGNNGFTLSRIALAKLDVITWSRVERACWGDIQGTQSKRIVSTD